MHSSCGLAACESQRCHATEVSAQLRQLTDDRLEEVEVDPFKPVFWKCPLSAPAVQQIDDELLANLFLCSELFSGESDFVIGNKQRNFIAPGRQVFDELRVLNIESMQFCPWSARVSLQTNDKRFEFLPG
ncbi:hypothetical protein D3C85_931980 [compost metagenome]